MCCPCGFLCCGSDEFGRCGCDDCPDPRCHDTRPDDAPDPFAPFAGVEDDDLPLAALSRAPARFRCIEV